MSYILEKVSIDSFYGNLLLGVLKILEKNPRISNVTMDRPVACLPQDLAHWEQMNGVKMPQDLRNFYLSTNGFKLNWSYRFGPEILPVGAITICPLYEFILMTGYTINTPSGISVVDHTYTLSLGPESKVFQLVQVDEEAKVCLIYPQSNSTPSIWLADEELNWHFISNRFMEYFRIAILHLGLPYWQFCFTPQGVPAWVEQIILMDAPHILNHRPYDIHARKSVERDTRGKKHENVIDRNLFKREQQPNYYYNEWLKCRWKNSR